MRLGPELEFTIFDREGRLSNGSYTILKELKDNEKYDSLKSYICPEASKVLIEMGCPPSESLDGLVRSFVGVLDILVKGADAKGFLVAPVSTFVQDSPIEISEEERIRWILPIIGAGPAEQRSSGLQVTSTQVHLDLEDKDVDKNRQFMLATALDSTFALMSHSCFYDGVHHGNDMRVPQFRFGAHYPFPELGGLVPYQRSYEHLKNHFKRNEQLWRRRLVYYDQDPNLPATKIEGPFGYMWGHPRITLKGEKRTIEMRSADANIPSNCLAYFALMKGAFLALRDVKLQIAEEEAPRDRFFTVQPNHRQDRLILPPFSYVKFLECQSYNHALRDEQVRTYLQKVVAFAKRGLPETEHKYLLPFEVMLDTRDNWSDELLRYARKEHLTSNDALVLGGAKQLRLHAHECFKKDLEGYLITP